jgi:hypothetical protein
MTFRRPKLKKPWRLIAIVGGAAVVLVAFAIVMGVIEGNGEDSTPVAASAKSAAPAAEEPSAVPTEDAATSQPVAEEALTVENSDELAALLSGPTDGPAVEGFSVAHEGELIQFDGFIGAMGAHDGATTRYDILILAGDFDPNRSARPNFQ